MGRLARTFTALYRHAWHPLLSWATRAGFLPAVSHVHRSARAGSRTNDGWQSFRKGSSADRLSMPLDLSAIRTAHDRIRPHIHRTPVLTSERLDAASGASLFFKCENFQKVGAFK